MRQKALDAPFRVGVNRPFAGASHMVRNKLCWDANDAVGLPKQRNSYQSNPTFLCFESPTALFASQHNLFRTISLGRYCSQKFSRPHKNEKPAFSNTSALKSVFGMLRFCEGFVWTVGLTVEIKLRFREGFVWTAGLTVEIKLRFRDGLVWTVGLTVEIKLRFRDGLVWTVGLTVEIKLRFRDGLVWTVGLTVEIKLRFRERFVWTVGLTVEIRPRFREGFVWTVGLTVEIKLRFRIPQALRGRGQRKEVQSKDLKQIQQQDRC